MASLPLYGHPAVQPALLRCILYCEFDTEKGPRPVFQAPQSYISNEVCEVLSDHLIASSELCGRIISVAAFGLRFVGHPQYIKDQRYPRNQFMFNVCFVFDAQTDPIAYTQFVKQLAQDFKALEVEHRYLSDAATRPLIENILQGVLQDVNENFRLKMPPSSFQHTLPVYASKSQQNPALPEYLATSSPNKISPHEVPVLFIEISAREFYDHARGRQRGGHPPVQEEGADAVLALIDGHNNVQDIETQTQLGMDQVLHVIRSLLGHGVIRLIDRIKPGNKYIPTTLLSELLSSSAMREMCVQYCALHKDKHPPDFSLCYRLLAALTQAKTLAQVCLDFGLAEKDEEKNMDVLKLVRFARASRFLRRLDHFPIWTNHPDFNTGSRSASSMSMGLGLGLSPDAKKTEQPSKASKAPPLVLKMADGDHCFDEIALTLGMTEEEVEAECCRGPFKDEVLVVAKMSQAGSTEENP